MGFRSILGSTALFTLSATAAFADISPEEVWQNWQDVSAAMGQNISAASTAREGDTLVVKGIAISSAQDGVKMDATLEELRLQDTGDGKVRITLSPEYPVNMHLPAQGEGGKPSDMTLLISHENMEMIASGSAEALAYDLKAPSVKIKLDRVEGVDTSAGNLAVEATLANITGTYGTTGAGAALTTKSEMKAETLALAVVGSNAEDGSEGRMTAQMKGIEVSSDGTPIKAMAGTSLAAMGPTETHLTVASSTFDIEAVDGTGPTTIKGTSGVSGATMAIAEGMFDYALSQKDVAVSITTPTVPLPDMALTFDETAFALKMPVEQTEASAPFALQTRLTNLALSDQIWAMFDPSAALPRDPVNLVIDSEGTMKLGGVPNAAAPIPAEIDSLNLKELKLSVAGAELTGAGGGTFDYASGPVPKADAKFDLKLLGANALMDKLVAAGFITAEGLTMPRMMLAMVAKIGPSGGDEYVSVIELKDKALLANGQKLYEMP